MVDWVSFGLNAIVPILAGLVTLLSVALYVVGRDLRRRVPDKAEMMDMGYTLMNTIIDERLEQFGIPKDALSSGPPSGSSPGGAGRPAEGLLGKLMWFAENTDIGRHLAARFLGGVAGGGGGGGNAPDYYGP